MEMMAAFRRQFGPQPMATWAAPRQCRSRARRRVVALCGRRMVLARAVDDEPTANELPGSVAALRQRAGGLEQRQAGVEKRVATRAEWRSVIRVSTIV